MDARPTHFKIQSRPMPSRPGFARVQPPEPKIDPLWIPSGLEPTAAMRWCLGRTLRELRASAVRGKTMPLGNVRRLFLRRWSRVADLTNPPIDDHHMHTLSQTGVMEIELFYRLRHPFVRRNPSQ